jgi:membrane-associated phospholipid phosphatase
MAISILFHPLLVPTYALMAGLSAHVWVAPVSAAAYWAFIFLFFFLSALLPISLLLVGRWLGLYSSIKLEDRRERSLPLTLILLVFIGYSLTQIGGSTQAFQVLDFFLFGLIGLTATTLFFNFVIKISGHAMAMAAFLGLWIGAAYFHPNSLLMPILASTIALWGLVVWSRLYLSAHSQTEVVLGTVVGILFGLIYSLRM